MDTFVATKPAVVKDFPFQQSSSPKKCVQEPVGKDFYFAVKRCFDIIFSSVVLLIFSPLFLIISLLIYIGDPNGSPFFVQTRCGKDGKPFKMIKFRTMVLGAETMVDSLAELNERDGPVFKIKNDPRITKFGRILRKTGLDELPQFVNVFLGDMSVVGPRPPLPREVAQYDDMWKLRLAVVPGITCEWQIAPNRDDIPANEWLKMDIDYILSRSFFNDLRIVFLTVLSVFRCDGH